MGAQITGLSQAQRNANDGISVVQTAEGALNQINDNLQRVRELTVQAENGTNSTEDLGSIQDEISLRLEEINRISEQTDFNGTKVLDGSKTTIDIQVGADDGQTISINLRNMDSSSLDLEGFNVTSAIGTDDLTQATLEDGQVTPETVTAANTTFTQDGEEITVAGADFVEYTDSEDNTAYAVKVGDEYFAADVNITDGDGAGTDATAEVTLGATLNVVDGASVVATEDPLATLDNALSQVDGMRSDLGAVQNRFDSAITNLATTETNLTAARSRIQDADYATEVSNMTRNQILQQAGTSILAQANQLPQTVLSLLG